MFDLFGIFGFFKKMPTEAQVEKDVEFAYDKTGTLEVGSGATYELPLDVQVQKDGEYDIGVTVE